MVDDGSSLTPQNIIDHNVSRIVVDSKNVTITLKPTADRTSSEIEIPWSMPNKRERPRIDRANEDAVRAPNPQLVQAVVRAHARSRLLSDGAHRTVESLAKSIGVHPKIVRSSVRLAFLAPDITKAIFDGDQALSLRLKILSAQCLFHSPINGQNLDLIKRAQRQVS